MRRLKCNFNRYLLLAIFVSCCIMLIKKTNIFEKIYDPINRRDLAILRAQEYSCNKSGSRLTNKYLYNFTEETGDPKENLSKAQESIVNFARHSTYSNIKPYLKRVGIYIFFLCLAVIIIFLWISYCSCICCNALLFSSSGKNNKFRFIFYLISAIMNLLVIIFSIVILSLTNPFFRRLNGLFCSTLTLLEHLVHGFGSHYSQYTSEWTGLNHILERFNESNEQYKEINKTYIDETYEEAISKCALGGPQCDCNITELEETKMYFDLYYSVNYITLDIPSSVLDMKGAIIIIDDTRIDSGDNIYNFLHDYGNRHIKNACIAIFVLTLIIGVLGLVFISLNYLLKNNIYKIVYIVIWNISMLFVILAIVVSVIFGVLGYVFTDGVQVLHYILSTQNINGDDPVLFTKKNEFLSMMIEECANQDGNFISILGDVILGLQDDLDESYNEDMNDLENNKCYQDTKDALIKFYKAAYDGTSKIIYITGNLYNIKCRFAKKDKNIILNELESAGKRATVLSTFQFLVGIFLGISVLSGILLVHKYGYNNNKNNYEIKNVVVNQSSGQTTPGNYNKSFDFFNNTNN